MTFAGGSLIVAMFSHSYENRCNVKVDTGENLGAKGPLKHLKNGHPKGDVIFGECASVITTGQTIKITPGLQLSVEYKSDKDE
jgi:hypothetical protein